MFLRPFLVLLAVAGNVQAAVPTASSPAIIPEAGPHAVGLRIVQQYDYSRVLEAPIDAFGKAGSAGPARPIQTLVWYPARRTGAAPMLVADYYQTGLADVDFALPGAEAAKQRAAWMAGPMKAQFGASTLAVRGAPPVDGKFPVVIYAPSFAASAHENLDLGQCNCAAQGAAVGWSKIIVPGSERYPKSEAALKAIIG